jgi:hypothetical protein
MYSSNTLHHELLGGALASNRSVFGIQVPNARPCDVEARGACLDLKGAVLQGESGAIHVS